MKEKLTIMDGAYNQQMIATLGPEGTCSEAAAKHYINLKNLVNAKINLTVSFETAIDMLVGNHVDVVIIPSAYSKLSEIIFVNYYEIEIVDTFLFKTPDLVVVTSKDNKIPIKMSISCHSTPVWLIKKDYPNADIVNAKSNSDAANILLANQVDACLTTIICAVKNNLQILHNYSGINMSWNVLMKRIV